MAKSKKRADMKRKGKVLVPKAVGNYANPGGKRVNMGSNIPRLLGTEKGLRVSNTEFLSSVIVAVGGTSGYARVAISPAKFGWAANIAKNYSRYRVHSVSLSYLPTVPTTQGGSVDMGVFYDVEDAINWFALGGPDSLFACGNYATGPPYAGGCLTTGEGRPSDSSWFGVAVDCDKGHRTYPWLLVDPAPLSGNLNAAELASVGLRWTVPTAVAGNDLFMGRLFISYDIEFIDPVANTNNAT